MRQDKESDLLVSVVVPTHKRAEGIRDVVETVERQSLKYWELIIVDDNDPDSEHRSNTASAVAPLLNKQIRYVQQPRNAGACAARNRGVAESNGQLIAFLDDDDQWHLEKLQRQVARFMSNPDLELLICGVQQLGYGRSQIFDFKFDGDFFDHFLNEGKGVCCSAIMVRKTAFQRAGGFDPEQPSYQDLDLMLRMARTGKTEVIHDALTIYRVGEQGITRNPSKKIEGIKRLLDTYAHELEQPRYARGRQALLTKLGDFAILTGERRLAIRSYVRALSAKLPTVKLLFKFLISFGITKELYLMWIDRRWSSKST